MISLHNLKHVCKMFSTNTKTTFLQKIQNLPEHHLKFITPEVDKICEVLHRADTKSHTLWSQRNEPQFTYTKEWKFMTSDELTGHLEKTKIMKKPYTDRKYRSRYGHIDLCDTYSNTYDIFVSDWIMFNKYELTLNRLDRLLSMCRYKEIAPDAYQLDGWRYLKKFHDKPTYLIDAPTYLIDYAYDDEKIMKIPFVSDDKQKGIVVRIMIQIMNETPAQFVNFHNYQLLGLYHELNDWTCQSWKKN